MALITAEEARELTEIYLSEQIEKELNNISDQIRESAKCGLDHLPLKTFNDFSTKDIDRLITILESYGFRVSYKEGDSFAGYSISW